MTRAISLVALVKYALESFEYLDTGISVSLSLDEIDYNKYKDYIEVQ